MSDDPIDRIEKQLEKLDKRLAHYERMYADAVATNNRAQIVECLIFIRRNQQAKIQLLTGLVIAMGQAAKNVREENQNG